VLGMSLINEIYNESPTKAKSRLKIIDNGFNLFAENGIDSISLANIAEVSGITIRNLYRYYSSKESLITDIAYYYISIFNSANKITVNKELNGYEQLKDVLEKQIEHKLLSDNNHVILSFIAYFDIYMTKSNVEHEDIKKYINIYAPRLKENVREGTKLSLIQGVKDGTLNIKMDEVDCYVGYIFHSLMSLLSRVSIKHYDTDFQKFDYVQKHIDVILLHLKK